MADINISKYTTQVLRVGSTPSSPGFSVSEGQDPVDPSGNPQTHLPVTITTVATGLSITESQVLGGAGTVGQYIRGDGSLADFPESSGGGSSVSYYLNGSVAQGTIGGVAYKELNKVPILGAGTDFTINANGYIASFLTDAGDPNLLEIPGGNWNFETYFSASSGGGSPTFYVELYKYDGSTFTLIASSSSVPELIAFGTTTTPYFSSLAVPTTVLALTDRLAVRYYVTHSGRTITLHTEDNHLCQIVTTFTTGITALNGLTAQVQNFAVGSSGTDFAIASATATHTFNLPTASATNRGALSSADWTTFNGKQNALTNPVTGTGNNNYIAKFTSTGSTVGNSLLQSTTSNVFINQENSSFGIDSQINTRLGFTKVSGAQPYLTYASDSFVIASSSGANIESSNTFTPRFILTTSGLVTLSNLAGSGTRMVVADSNGLLSTQVIITNPVTGTGSAGQVAYFTGTTTISSESNLFWDATNNRLGINNSTPEVALDLGNTGGQKFYNYNGGSGNRNGLGLDLGGFSYEYSVFFAYGESDNGRITFGSLNGTTYSTKMTIFGNGNVNIIGNNTANSFVKSGGTSSQFLKADGSVDSSSYLTTGTASSTYLTISNAASTYVTLSTAQTITGLKTFSTSGVNMAEFTSTFATGGVISLGRSGVSVGNIGNSGSLTVGILDDLEIRSGNSKSIHLRTDAVQFTLSPSGGTATLFSANSSTPTLFLNTTGTNQASGIVTQQNGGNKWAFGTNFGSGDDSWNVYNYAAASRFLTITAAGAATFSSTLGINGVSDSVKGGTYTPTASNTGNLTSVAPQVCQFIRVGNIVNVSGVINIQPTISGAVFFDISLPVFGGNFANFTQTGGNGVTNVVYDSYTINSNGGTTRVSFNGVSTYPAVHSLYFTFQYIIL